MRKSMTRVLLLALILALLCVGALAAEEASATVNIKDKDYSVVPTENYEKFILSYTADEGEQLVMLLKGEEAPNASNIYYIDQQTGNGNFTIYPKQLTSGTYRLLVANSHTAKEVATIDYTAAGVTVSGTALSWNSKDDAVYVLYSGDTTDTAIIAEWNSERYTGEVCAAKGKPEVSGKQYAQTFSFEAVPEGDYKLAIFKPGKYAPKIMSIAVGVDSFDLGEQKLWLYGDANYDGAVTTPDATQALRYFTKKNPNAFSLGSAQDQAERLFAADVNKDNVVNTVDAAQVLRYFNKKTPNLINNLK